MCQEGMSPLMERFTLNKQKAAQNHKQPTGESEYKKYNARKWIWKQVNKFLQKNSNFN